MADNNAHPGVRSLLAKFETSQSPLTSPQSRGRSPVGSDSSESVRQGSQVRTNFVSVEEAIGSHHGSPLRKTSGRSGSPAIFGPQINAEEVKARRQNVVSPTPAGNAGQGNNVLDQPAKGASEGDSNASEQTGKEEAPRAVAHSPKEAAPAAPAVPPQKADPIPNAHVSAPAPAQSKSTEKLAPKTVSKRPSNISASKSNAPSKPASTTPTSTDHKSSSGTTGTKPPSAREAAKERSNAALARKQSRTSLNPASKPATTRMARGSTPSQESSRRSPSDQSARTRAKSPTRPARIPAAATAATQASAAKLGSASTSTGSTTGSTGRANTASSTLTRKPSSLKSATGTTQTRPSVGSATGVRRQASRPSLPTQSAQERPSSRTSDAGSKPMNEGFLARMMRPTASSASKSHEKSESKPPAKVSPPVKAPRQSVGRPAERNTAPPKGKTAAPLRPQTEKSQPPKKEVAPPKEVKPLPEKQDEEKENLEEAPSAIPEEPQVQEAIIEEPDLEARATPALVDMNENETEQVVPQPAAQTAAEQDTKTTEPSTIHNESGARIDHPTESGSKVSTQEDGPVDTGDGLTESNEEASEASVVPETKDTEETPVPTNQDATQEEVSSEAKAESLSKDATKDTVEEAIAAISTPAEQNLTEQEVPEALKSDEPSVKEIPEDKPKPAEISEPVPQAESADKPAEEPVPAPHFTTENKSTADDIDFNSLALS